MNTNPVPIQREALAAAAATKFTVTQHRILLAVWILTYGKGKMFSNISYGMLEQKTGIDKHQIARSIKGLFKRNILKKIETPVGLAGMIGFNEHYEEWLLR